jgi:hypothetical protein
MRKLASFLLVAVSCPAVTLQFSTTDPSIGPFPSDAFTVADANQKTGRRVNLPPPAICTGPSASPVNPSICIETAQLNQLDGFHVMPRVRLQFSGPINPDTLRDGVRYMALDNLTNDEYGINFTGQFIPINEVVYDPLTNTGYFKPDIIIDQHRRFAIIVTDAVRDSAGNPVEADPAFTACASRQTIVAGDYCGDLTQVAAQQPRFSGMKIIGAAIFTTMSATANLEAMRARLQDTPLNMRPLGDQSIFAISDLTGATLRLQEKTNSAVTTDTVLPVQLLGSGMRLAFGTFNSPSFVGTQLTMPDTPTNAPAPAATATSTLAFHLYLPTAAPPASGYPVVIFGHGFGDTSFGGPSAVATVFTQAGFAVAAINAFGHGSGPNSVLSLTDRTGASFDIPIGGRGVDIDQNGTIDPFEGCVIPTLVAMRDCLRQTVVDLMQFTRLLRSGSLDFGKSGTVSLNGSRVYYTGQSLGGVYGTIFSAVEPNVRASALNVAGGSIVEIARLSPAYHAIALAVLGSRIPSLLNEPVCGPGSITPCLKVDFNDDYVGRWRPAKRVTVPNAITIQNYFEAAEWYQMPGDPAAYAPHLKQSTLPGVPIKGILFQIARADMSMPNPASSTVIRNAWMRDYTVMYRHDLARKVIPDLPENPHIFLLNLFSPSALPIALAAQAQITGFLASDGTLIPDINPLIRRLVGIDLFETPDILPEDLGFTPGK